MGKFALLIGVSEYLKGKNPLSALPAALNDVRALEAVLDDSTIGEFDQVTVLENPSHGEMRSAIADLFGFLGDRLGDKPIVIKAKFADGRVFEMTAHSRAELAAGRETLEMMAKIK